MLDLDETDLATLATPPLAARLEALAIHGRGGIRLDPSALERLLRATPLLRELTTTIRIGAPLGGGLRRPRVVLCVEAELSDLGHAAQDTRLGEPPGALASALGVPERGATQVWGPSLLPKRCARGLAVHGAPLRNPRAERSAQSSRARRRPFGWGLSGAEPRRRERRAGYRNELEIVRARAPADR